MEQASSTLHMPLANAALSRLGDEPLARLAGAGRRRAFAVLFERYHQPLYRYCRSMLRSEVDAQDALQSTFAAALAALQRGQRNAPLRPWLFRIAHNESVSLLRRGRAIPMPLEDRELGNAASAQEEADARARLALLVSDLRELPDRQRSALLMRELSGLSHAEIAAALGTSLGAAKQAIFDARAALAERAEGRAMLCDDVRRTLSNRDGRALRGRRIGAHLRDCGSCAAFVAAIEERRADLRALAPLMPPVATAALLARVSGSASSSAAGGGSASLGAAGAGKLGSSALAVKGLAGVVVIATAAGVGGLVKVMPHAGGAQTPAVIHTGGPHAGSASGGARPAAPSAGAVVLAGGRQVAGRSAITGGLGAGSAAARRAGRTGQVGADTSTGTSSTSSTVGGPSTTGLGAAGSAGGTGSSGASHGASGSSPGASGSSPGKSGSQHGASGTPGQPVHPIHPVHPVHPTTPGQSVTHPAPIPRPHRTPGGSSVSRGNGSSVSGANSGGSSSR